MLDFLFAIIEHFLLVSYGSDVISRYWSKGEFLDLWANIWGISGNICTLSEIFNTKKPCSSVSSPECQFCSKKQRISVSEPPFWEFRGNVCDSFLARLKADIRLSISYN